MFFYHSKPFIFIVKSYTHVQMLRYCGFTTSVNIFIKIKHISLKKDQIYKYEVLLKFYNQTCNSIVILSQ